jgi:hypothetical protein
MRNCENQIRAAAAAALVIPIAHLIAAKVEMADLRKLIPLQI